MYHEWKVIHLFLINTYLGKIFKFHSNLEILYHKVKQFANYYQKSLKN